MATSTPALRFTPNLAAHQQLMPVLLLTRIKAAPSPGNNPASPRLTFTWCSAAFSMVQLLGGAMLLQAVRLFCIDTATQSTQGMLPKAS